MALSEDTLRIEECRITCLSLLAVQRLIHLRVSVGLHYLMLPMKYLVSIGPLIGSWRTRVYKLSSEGAGLRRFSGELP